MVVAFGDMRADRMSGSEFRTFQETRPDRERWELIGGVAVMTAPPTLTHNQISANLQRLLDYALDRHDPSLLAAQRPGVELGDGDYKPEPDIAVIDATYDPGQRFVDKAYLLAEVVSASDEITVPGTSRRWVEVKRDIYRAHEHCRAVLIVSQDRMEVTLDIRNGNRWETSVLTGGGAELAIAAFGLQCSVAELYDKTPLVPRPTPGHRV
ncbi:Uma2 family endonuclease [Xanthobacteraceae bacterium Astr-EGSB]|uniref:Uma2 family endonuclease n=1 Tax=Astrobacterium formosum TaxID=3069710 RepID=UPI0027B19893|nr:Uma2 family endonuclease [Xanthobacteraceae bacterium Astr-EGSB]